MNKLTRRQVLLGGLATSGLSYFDNHFRDMISILSHVDPGISAASPAISVSPHLVYFFGDETNLNMDVRSLFALTGVQAQAVNIITSAQLRNLKAEKFFFLGGQPFGPSVEERLKGASKNQEEADRAANGSNYDLIYLGSFNNSYGRLCRGDGNFATSLVGATGTQTELLKSLECRTFSDLSTKNVLSEVALISDAYPHFYHLLKSPLKQFDRYLIDRVTRSSESVYLVLAKSADKRSNERLKVAAEKLATRYSQRQLAREQNYLDGIKKVLPVEPVQLPETAYEHFCRLKAASRLHLA
ncbi:MAG: hypothetical protein HUU57_16850 [Bdellovibrio sp.]|nr:hypothetical protein [Bdellovibrio sp.]